MATTKKVTPGREGYKILFSENIVIMNHKFAAAAAIYNTPQNALIRNIRKDFPGMKEAVVSGHDCHSAKKNRRLTYENMETHIGAYDNADELMAQFETVKSLSQTCVSPYKYVCDWFIAQFPLYAKAPTSTQEGLVMPIVKAPEIKLYKTKEEKVN